VDLVAAVVADEQSLEVMQPGEGALDDPADAAEPGAVLGLTAGDLGADAATTELAPVEGCQNPVQRRIRILTPFSLARRQRTPRASKAATTTRARRAAKTRSPRAATPTTSASRSDSNGQRVDHHALLRVLFPAGIPPRQDVIEAGNDRLAQADRLARQG
jgi:hypothetical protein